PVRMQASTELGSPRNALGTNDVLWIRAANRIAACQVGGTSTGITTAVVVGTVSMSVNWVSELVGVPELADKRLVGRPLGVGQRGHVVGVGDERRVVDVDPVQVRVTRPVTHVAHAP